MLVMEHYPLGDLLSYLEHHGEFMTWERGKYRIAIGIARALAYLHSQSTPVVHRDLQASNVLLTETMRAKLTGFDSSCLDEQSHRCHGGVSVLVMLRGRLRSGQRRRFCVADRTLSRQTCTPSACC
ncbi:hypothetical protein PF003_g20313 [Phytophthora fragariae]|nr:hypothetical protein PF003_g20313 [Phytophthora fragariae]